MSRSDVYSGGRLLSEDLLLWFGSCVDKQCTYESKLREILCFFSTPLNQQHREFYLRESPRSKSSLLMVIERFYSLQVKSSTVDCSRLLDWPSTGLAVSLFFD